MKFKEWWNGTPEPYDGIMRVKQKVQHHWTASFVRSILKFFREDWKWIISTMIAIAALIVAAIAVISRLP